MKLLPLAMALILAAPPAFAHKLKVFAAAEGAQIVGTAYFAGGGKAMAGAGQLIGPDGTVVAGFRTDAEGGFRLPVALRQDYRVTVDSGDGHVAETLIAAAELPETLPAGAATTRLPAATPAPTAVPDQIEAAVARQIIPLRRQIDAMEERARFSDIIGGVGT
ncbi:MAG TPA: hypothetical protein VK196_04225, partial [Magnetospirillum sp.]|nr:hypothetical protein [Magnetospirillum sp.]